MLGVEGARDGATQPMTANFEDQDREAGVLWIFTAKDHDLTRAMGQSNRAIGSILGQGPRPVRKPPRHACDRQRPARRSTACGTRSSPSGTKARTIPRWRLVRFDVEDAKIWMSDVEGFLKPAINKLLGRKPEAGMKEKVAEVSL